MSSHAPLNQFLKGCVTALVSYLLLWVAAPGRAVADAYYVGTHLAGTDTQRAPDSHTAQEVRLVVKFLRRSQRDPEVELSLRKQVEEITNNTGLFVIKEDSASSTSPTLTISLENLSNDVLNTAKSIPNALSFGLIGNTYVNRYVCTAEYRSGLQATTIVGTAEHVIFITRGLKKPPADSERSPNFLAAFAKMSEQVVSRALQNLAADPAL